MGDNTFKKVIEYTDEGFNMDRLIYCFPGREWVMSSEECNISCEYGYMWPFPFVSVLYGDKGKTYIHTGRGLKGVNIKKTSDALVIIFLFQEEHSNEPLAVFEHDGNPESAIRYFQEWHKGYCGKMPEMDEDIKGCFHVRRLFFNDCFCGSSVLKDGEICLKDIISNDITECGGADAVLLFDYGYNKKTGIRCGNDRPDMLDEKSVYEINKQMDEMRSEGIKGYYVYFDPYLVQKKSSWDKKYRGTLEIKDKCGNPVRVWGGGQWHPCTGEKAWQNESSAYIKEAMKLFGADGIYLDEVGNGTQYRCFRADHKHQQGQQLEYERDYVCYISDQFPDKKLMCEFAPVYDMAKYFNIVMSDTRSVVNIYRFILPQIRFVRIINCDRPLGHSEWEINKSFFNGEGLWIDNDLNNELWYPAEVRKLIKEHYLVLHKFFDCFSSEKARPMFNAFSDYILANRFEGGNGTVITLLNTDTREREVTLEGDAYKNSELLLPVKSVRRGDDCLTICMGEHEVTAIHILYPQREENKR